MLVNSGFRHKSRSNVDLIGDPVGTAGPTKAQKLEPEINASSKRKYIYEIAGRNS